MSDLDSILDQLPTDMKVAGNLIRGASAHHESPQSCIRNQRCCTSGVSCFFVVVIVITRQCTCRTVPNGRVSDYGQSIRRVAEKHVRNFFHQCRSIATLAVRWIQDHQTPTVR